MKLITTPVVLACLAGTGLVVLISLAARIGMPASSARPLLSLVLAGAIAAALTTGAALERQRFLQARHSVGVTIASGLAGFLALLALHFMAGIPQAMLLDLLPGLVAGIILHRLLRRPAGGGTVPASGTARGPALLLALSTLVLMLALALVLAHAVSFPFSAALGVTQPVGKLFLVLLALLSFVIGGLRGALALALLAAMTGLFALFAVFVGFGLVNSSLLVPLLSAPSDLATASATMAAIQPGSTAGAGWWTLPSATSSTAAFASQLFVCGLTIATLSLLRIEQAIKRGPESGNGTAPALMLAALLALMLAALPLNHIQTLQTHLIGFDPLSLPLWMADGRFASAIEVCGVPLGPGQDWSSLCPPDALSRGLAVSDLAVAPDRFGLQAGLAAGLPPVASSAVALALAAMGSGMLFLVFARLALLLGLDGLVALRPAPMAMSAQLALTRLAALLAAALIVVVPSRWIEEFDLLFWLLPVFASFSLARVLLLRFGESRNSRHCLVGFAAAAAAAIALHFGAAMPSAGLIGMATGGLLAIALLVFKPLLGNPEQVQSA